MEREQLHQPDSYSTGRTHPRKSFRGVVGVLLVAVITLGGLASLLGVMNFSLFRRMLSRKEDAPVIFHPDVTSSPTADAPAANTSDQVTVQLQKSPLSVQNVPQDGGLPLQDIYRKALPSVVSISCRTDYGTSTGTGVVLTEDGYIVTNCHVVDGADSIGVMTMGGQTLRAQLVGADEVSDLAVLYVKSHDLQAAEFGDSAVLRVGDAVVAIGDPLGVELRGTMTDGIVSAINRDVTVNGRTMTLIQTNAALNAGNSGGPLLNCYGQVIGINTLKIGDYVSDAGVEGLGFAIPSTTVKEIVDQLASQGFVSGRPSLGFTAESVSPFVQMYYRLPQGAYITAVSGGSDAEEKGVEPGDIVLSLDGRRLSGADEIAALLYGYSAGDSVQLTLYRDGKQYDLTLTLGENKG